MIRLRPATRDDAPLLRHWDQQPHVISADPHDDWQWETSLAVPQAGSEHLIAELDGRPIGYMQILDPAQDEEGYWGDVPAGHRALDIWIGEASDLGRGYGTRMMHMAIQRCFADPSVSSILIDPLASNLRAHRFYERLGFRFRERRRFGADDCFVFELSRGDWPVCTGDPSDPGARMR